ncbi:MAG: hypothetical protein CK426_04950 [Legionella sp.]|nr:MAG: hypothetical protein CK423_01440 [Legionella sp.]PJD98707.1 MAG: hypothetical protein CK426_04950 [Legionella sp.]
MAKRTQQPPEQPNITIWSWLLRLLSTNFLVTWLSALFSSWFAPTPSQPSSDSTDEHSKAIALHHRISPVQLPGNLMGEILSYLIPRDIKSALFLNRSFYKELNASGALTFLKAKMQFKRFCALIAIEGEGNQNKAEAMLKASIKEPELVLAMLTERTTIQDAAGRTFQDMSAYGYAFWSGDTRMRRMMEQYMSEEAKNQAYEECYQIENKGVDFTFRGEKNTGSTHFDFQPLLNAYIDYLTAEAQVNEAAAQVNEAAIYTEFNRAIIELWLNIGKEQAKVPTHVAQEYCSNQPFEPQPTFEEPDLKRTVIFYDRLIHDEKSWWGADLHSELGSSVAISKGENKKGQAIKMHQNWYQHRTEIARQFAIDARAIEALYQARIVNDPKKTLTDLRQEEHGARLIC